MSDKRTNNKFEQLRKLAEDFLREREQSSDKSSFPENFAELIHELEVHQIELEMQHTELGNAYRSLEKSRNQYNDLFDFAPVGYMVTDREGVIHQANLTIAVMIGIDRGELIGRKFSSFLVDDSKEVYYIHRRMVFRKEEQQSCDIRVNDKENSHRFVRLNSEIVPEQPDTCRTSITDISHIKQAELVLQRALQREKELNELKTRLISVISHEMRTPLSAIMSSIDIMDRYGDKLTEAKRDQHYERVRAYVWFLTDIIQDVVTAHHVSDDSPIMRLETFDVVPVVEQLTANIADLVDEDKDRVELQIRPGECPQMVTWDRHLIRRIIVNLLQNALKYSDSQVTCTMICDEQEITIRITDEGKGIPEEDHPYIFDMFYRGSNTISIRGTGIGLAIVKEAVEAHDGTITFKTSRYGTKFTVKLPRHTQRND